VGSSGFAELDLRAARAQRRSQLRRVQQRSRRRTRRRLQRVSVSAFAVGAVALAAVAGPKATSTIGRSFDPVAAAPRCPVPSPLRPAFVQASRETGVRLGLLTAVAHVESRFDPNARSSAGAVGLLQLLPTTAAALHYDPEETSANVMAGALYLRQLLDRYGDTRRALAAYNAGPTAVDLRGPAPNAETRAYVARVQALQRRYAGCS
jgi:soluble lytic murein transglycosylase-like protein